jgi:hypothetical protein
MSLTSFHPLTTVKNIWKLVVRKRSTIGKPRCVMKNSHVTRIGSWHSSSLRKKGRKRKVWEEKIQKY